MKCPDIDELTEAYVLGALDSRETAAIDAHLSTCANCRARVESYRKTLDGVLASVPEVEPPSGHRERFHNRLMAHIEADTPPKRRIIAFPRLAAFTSIAAAILLVAVVGLSLLASNLSNDLNQTRTALANTQAQQAALQATLSRTQNEKTAAQTTIDKLTHDKDDLHGQLLALENNAKDSARLVTMLAQPDVVLAEVEGTTEAPTAIAHVVMAGKSKSGAVLASNWPALPPNKTYQLWYLPTTKDQQSIAGQAFTLEPLQTANISAGSGAFLFDAPDTMDHYRGIGITIEPPGGSPRPTSPIYLLSDFHTS